MTDRKKTCKEISALVHEIEVLRGGPRIPTIAEVIKGVEKWEREVFKKFPAPQYAAQVKAKRRRCQTTLRELRGPTPAEVEALIQSKRHKLEVIRCSRLCDELINGYQSSYVNLHSNDRVAVRDGYNALAHGPIDVEFDRCCAEVLRCPPDVATEAAKEPVFGLLELRRPRWDQAKAERISDSIGGTLSFKRKMRETREREGPTPLVEFNFEPFWKMPDGPLKRIIAMYLPFLH